MAKRPQSEPSADRPGRIGDYWLSKRTGSPFWHRTWYCESTRQTRRVSVGTADFSQATQALALWVAGNRPLQQAESVSVTVAEILVRYYEGHGRLIPSAEQQRIALGYWTDFFSTDLVSDLTRARQDAFVTWLAGKDHSTGYISRTLSAGRAALNWAVARDELASAPSIAEIQTSAMRRAVEPKGRKLSLAELALLFEAAQSEHIQGFLLIATNTLARPDAIFDLDRAQVELDDNIVHLNPPGRVQTRKYRPTLPLTRCLRGWVEGRRAGPLLTYQGKRLSSIKTAFRKLRVNAGLDHKVTAYSLRHTMAVLMRRRGVAREDVSRFLGHQPRDEARTTDIYASYEPGFLREAADAIDAIMADLQAICSVPLHIDLPLRPGR